MTKPLLAGCLAALISAAGVPALAAAPDWEADVRKFDAGYWAAYNKCDVDKLAGMNTTDLEFYHDNGGVTVGRDKFAAAIKTNLCSNPKLRIRREAVAESIRVFPMRDEGKLYGAVMSGEHRFFHTEAGKAEVETGSARFTHLLTLTGGAWKLARVLSFDHGPVKFKSKAVEVTLTPGEMDRFVGVYGAKGSAAMTVRRAGNRLSLESGPTRFELVPTSPVSYFAKDRDLVFIFSLEAGGQRRVKVQEGGRTVEEATAPAKK